MKKVISIIVMLITALILSGCSFLTLTPKKTDEELYQEIKKQKEMEYKAEMEIANEEWKKISESLDKAEQKGIDKGFDQTALPKNGEEIVVMETNKGTIKIQLFPEYTPKAVENFKGLIKKGSYDGLVFNSVSPTRIEGGNNLKGSAGGESLWGGKFEKEINHNLKDLRGAVGMVGGYDAKGTTGNGSQFFVLTKSAPYYLEWQNTIFGQVFEGMDVVDSISKVKTKFLVVPVEDIVIEKITLAKY
jgi:peptidyl-prolyl cis-trans isomerase B (cyclophilin B)